MSALDVEGLAGGDRAPRHLGLVPPGPVRCRCVGWRRLAKRGVDLGVGAVLFAALLPVIGAVAVATKLTTRGPVLFRQERLGRDGVPFEMLKIRTMHNDSTQRLMADPTLLARYQANDYKLPLADDPRITRLGRVLRRSSLDELPQLLNVLRGEMSLVGPRPIVAGELVCYGPWAAAYTAMRPGITGRWQTEGRNAIRYPERARLDAEYVSQYRLRDDVAIMARTVPQVLRRVGVH